MGKKGKGGGDGDEDVKRDKPLQAVLLADSFTSTFRPVSFETPKVLFPLANVPMLAYSLDFLASNNVKQVFVFSIAHAEQIRAYVESSGWGDRMDIKCLSSGSCRSAGPCRGSWGRPGSGPCASPAPAGCRCVVLSSEPCCR